MKFTHLSLALLLVAAASNAYSATTTEVFDTTAQTFTLSTTETSDLDVARWPAEGSFTGTFSVQFYGLNALPLGPFFLTIPITQTISEYGNVDYGQVCYGTACYSVPFNNPFGTQTLDEEFMLLNLNTTPFSWTTLTLTTTAFAQPGGCCAFAYNTTTTATEVINFGALTLTDYRGDSLLTPGVTFQVTPPDGLALPEPSTWALGILGLALLALGAKRVHAIVS